MDQILRKFQKKKQEHRNQSLEIDDLDSDKWKHYIMEGGELEIFGNTSTFRENSLVLTLNGNLLKKTECAFFVRISPHAEFSEKKLLAVR